jgi:TRAP-type C4-dicarboxylate transport system substrate-binding protein
MFSALRAAAIAATISFTSMLSAHAAPQKVIVGDTGAATSIIGRTLSLFKERAEKYSNGGLNVEIYSNSQLGTFATMATQMKVGLVNVMFIQPDALGQQVSIVTANSWPFLFANAERC